MRLLVIKQMEDSNGTEQRLADLVASTSPRPVTHLVDDEPSHLRSMSRLLKAVGLQVEIHDSASSFLSNLQPDMAGCVITDLRMPMMDGRQLQKALRDEGHELPVIFLTGHGDIPTSVDAMRSGAEDFLMKTAKRSEILDAICRAFERDRRNRERRETKAVARRAFDSLSEREVEGLRHVIDGRLNKQIADSLGVHERTVKFHRTHITRKPGVPSVTELTRLAMEAELFDSES